MVTTAISSKFNTTRSLCLCFHFVHTIIYSKHKQWPDTFIFTNLNTFEYNENKQFGWLGHKLLSIKKLL